MERRLKERCDIPVFHDDQHGTAVVITAALTNALKVVGKKKEQVKVVLNGIGAAGGAAAKLLLDLGYSNLILCDKDGILCAGDPTLRPHHAELAARTNQAGQRGTLADALVGADVFIGVSRPGLVTGEMVESMQRTPFSWPWPTRCRDHAGHCPGPRRRRGGTVGLSQPVNNVLVFPRPVQRRAVLRRGTDHRGDEARRRPGSGGLGPPEQLSPTCILPSPSTGPQRRPWPPRRRGGSPVHRACPVLIGKRKTGEPEFLVRRFLFSIFSPLSVTSPRSHTAA